MTHLQAERHLMQPARQQVLGYWPPAVAKETLDVATLAVLRDDAEETFDHVTVDVGQHVLVA